MLPPGKTITTSITTKTSSERVCAKCGRGIPRDERPWRFYSRSGRKFETASSDPDLVCLDCYSDIDDDP